MRLTVQDASFIYGETASGPMHGVAISVIEGEVPFERIYQPFRIAHPPGAAVSATAGVRAVQSGTRQVGRRSDVRSEEPSQALHAAEARQFGQGDRTRAAARRAAARSRAAAVVDLRANGCTRPHRAGADGPPCDGGRRVGRRYFDGDARPRTGAPDPPPPTERWTPKPLPSAVELVGEAMAEMRPAPAAFQPPPPAADPARAELLRIGTEVMTQMSTVPVMTAPWNAGSVGPKRKFQHTRVSIRRFSRDPPRVRGNAQ